MDGGERRGGMSRDGHSTRNYESTKSVRGCRGCSQPNTPCREAFKKNTRAVKRNINRLYRALMMYIHNNKQEPL